MPDKKKPMRILAIETSCDESSIALIEVRDENGQLPVVRVIKNLVASQIAIHAPFGGVVPNLAKREHIKNLPTLWSQMQKISAVAKKDIDLLAVTVGPGLEPALWTGIQFAQDLHEHYFDKKVPLVGANHLEGHLYSFLFSKKAISTNFPSFAKASEGTQFPHSCAVPVTEYQLPITHFFPAIALVVSGGHTILARMDGIGSYKKLGETLDDAVGESFDKVARLLDLPYPGGPLVEQWAKKGNPLAIPFPSPMLHQKNYNFSYAGLKTAVLYYLKRQGSLAQNFSMADRNHHTLEKIKNADALKADVAASFQHAAFAVLVTKTARAMQAYGAHTLVIGGGVAANKMLARTLRHTLVSGENTVSLQIPPLRYCQDNAAMIALAAYVRHTTHGKKLPLVADGTLSL